MDANLRQDIIDVLDELGAAVDTDIEEVSEIDEHVSLPGIKTDANGGFVGYVLAKMNVFQAYAKAQTDAIIATWNNWFGTSDETGIRGEFAALKRSSQAATQGANEAAESVRTAVSGCNTAAANANEKAALANEKASLADQKATAANTAAENATSIWNTVKNWFNGNSGFKATAEAWYNGVTSAWTSWFGSSSANGVQKEWADLKADAISKTNAANTAASNANEKATLAEQKATLADQKATLADQKATLANTAASNANEKATLADQKATLANTAAENATSIWNTVKNWFNGTSGFKATAEGWYNTVTAAWTAWFGSSASEGVQKDWADLRADVVSKTSAANTAAGNANEKAALANEKATLADQKAGFANEQGTRAKTYLDALQEELTEEAKQLLLGELCAPYIVGSTLVFPAQSTAKIVNSTLILAE